jgi:hypothetical protein
MFTLLIAVGALFLAVIVSAALDPWPGQADDFDGTSITDRTALSA